MPGRVFIGPLSDKQIKALKAVRQKASDAGTFQRVQAALLSSQGLTAPKIGQMLGCDRLTVTGAIRRFQDHGAEALTTKKPAGRTPIFHEQARQLLCQAVDSGPRALGYDFNNWSASRLAKHIDKEIGLLVSDDTIELWLKRLGFRYKRPKLQLKHRQDPAEVARARHERDSALKKSPIPMENQSSCSRMNLNSI